MSRVPGLDLLRAIAIAWVLLFHALTMGLGTPSHALARFGWMGVDLFFVLSGFLIGAQWLLRCRPGEPAPFGGFYLRRALRILPAFWLVLALYVLFPGLREREVLQSPWFFVTFTENLFADFSQPLTFSHAWSLCVEEHFYLFFPLLAWLLLRRPSARKTIACAAAIVLLGIGWRTWIWASDLRFLHEPDSYIHFYERIYYPTWTRLDGLLAGVMLAVVKTQRPALWSLAQQRWKSALGAGLLLLAASAIVFRDQQATLAVTIGYPLLALAMALVVFAFSSPETPAGRLAVPGAGGLAAISYSLYLSHKLVFHLVQPLVDRGTNTPRPLAFLVYAGAAIAAAALLHFAVERPFLKLRERLGSRREIAATARS